MLCGSAFNLNPENLGIVLVPTPPSLRRGQKLLVQNRLAVKTIGFSGLYHLEKSPIFTWNERAGSGSQPPESLSSPLEAGLSVLVAGVPSGLVEELEPEGCSEPSARRSKGLNSGSGTNRGVKRS